MKYPIKNICCIGAGYVGGPTMAIFAKYCPDIVINVVDLNKDRIKKWNSTKLDNLPIFEPGLEKIISENRGKNLFFSNKVEEKISEADMIFISVNTPTKEKGIGAGQASDLKWIDACARQISKYAKANTIVVEKSTLPVKTAQTIKQILDAPNNDFPDKNFSILSNPEFLSEGSAINNLENPDRVLIGGNNKDAIDALIDIYLRWVDKDKILTTDLWSSELSKLISNAFLAQRISSINSITALCEKTGANIKEVSIAIGSDQRIGKYFLNAGPGFGGSCFKKDISNLVYICNFYGLNETASYWQKVIDINQWQSSRISEIIVRNLFGTISGKKIGILGFSFKANTNDTRESPAIKICKQLLEEGAILKIYDPKVKKEKILKELSPYLYLDEIDNKSSNHKLIYSSSAEEASTDSDALVILTEWDEFKDLNWNKLSNLMRSPYWVFDTRTIINIEDAKLSGFNVWRIGDGTLKKGDIVN